MGGSDELRELYRELILDHAKSPRHFGRLEGATHSAEGVNPLCGDRMTLYIKLDGDHITDIRFKGTGCAISVASSSLMTERVKGTTVDESLMLEPTETESKETLDAFVQTLFRITHEAEHFEAAFPALEFHYLPVAAGERVLVLVEAARLASRA